MSPDARGVAVLVWYYAPPAVGIAPQRLLGFVRHLPEFGWDPVVIAPMDVHYHRGAEEISSLPEGTSVIRVCNPEPSRWLRGLVGGSRTSAPGPVDGVQSLAPVRTGTTGGLLRRLVRDWLYVPDAQLLWIRPAASAARRAILDSGRTRVVVHSSSVPFSAHFAARRAARDTGARWVAEYRDPWSAAPPQFGRRPALRRVVDRRLDETIVTEADAVVVTSETTADLFRTTFTRMSPGRLEVVRNGFDVPPECGPPAPEAPLALVYSGTLLHPSYAEPVLEALASEWERAPGAARLDVFGPPLPWQAAAERLGRPAPFLGLHGMVPPHEMPARLASASALLLLQPDPAHALYIAGKLYEYLGARRPVVAALPEGCEAERLLERHGRPIPVRPLTAKAVAEALSELLRGHRSGVLQAPTVTREIVEPLTRREQTRRLAGVLDRVARP